MSDIKRTETSHPSDVRLETGRWSGSITAYKSGEILAELGTGCVDVIGIESIEDCDAIMALASALRIEFTRLEALAKGGRDDDHE